MKISTLVLLSFLSIRVSAQLTLNGAQLLSSPGTYSGTIVPPPEAVLSVAGSGDYTLSGVIIDRVVQRPTLLPMTSNTGVDYFGGMITVTASSAYNEDYQGWKSISNSPSGEWVTRQRTNNFWLQVQYAVPVIITSAQLRSRSNNSGLAHWGIEGSVNGTTWTGLYSSANTLPEHPTTTVSWENTTAYHYYRFYGVSSNARNPPFNIRNPGLRLFQLLGDRTPTLSPLTVQAGSGKILLTGANTYSGTTTISSGTLQTGNGGTTGTLGTGAIINQAVLKINHSHEITLSNTISGSGALIQQGTGKTTLTAANTYTGGTTLNGGILKVAHLTALGTGPVTINSGTILDLRGGFSTITNTLNNSGGTILRDNGLYLNNTLLTSSAGTLYSADIVLTKNSTLSQAEAGTYTLSGIISGGYGLISDIGEGHTLLLTGANTYSGTTTISSGTLQTGGTTGTLGTGAITIANHAVLKINHSQELTLSNGISGSGALIQQGSGKTTLTAANTYTGGTTLNGGILKVAHLTALGTGPVTINSGTTLDLRGGFSTITNTLNNSGGTILRDDGLYLNNTFLTSNAGTPYSGDIVLTKNSTLSQAGAGTYTLSGVISGGYGLTSDIGEGHTLLLTGANTYSGPTTISSGTLQAGNGGTTGTLGTGAITIANHAVLTIHRSNEITLSNSISGGGSLIQQGTGKTILTAANTYTGGTTLNGGILKAGQLTALGTGAVAINSGTTLDLRGDFNNISNTINNNGGTLLRNDGLYWNNLWLTSTTSAPYSADLVVTQNSILTQLGTGTYTLSGAISGGYGLTSNIGEGHTLLLTGANTYSGPTTISSGTLQIGNGGTTGTLGTGAITIANHAVLKINHSNELTLSNTISGSGALIQQGSGKTILTAANTYTGGTTINGGILKAGQLTALGTGAVAINSGTTLDLRGDFNNISNTINNNGGTLLRNDGLYWNDLWLTSATHVPYSADLVLTQNSILTQLGTGTYTLSGVISGGYGITSDIGVGNTLLLTGANTYSGTTTISSGTLQTGNGGTTGTLGTGAIINHAVLKIHHSHEITLSNTISGSGALIQQGTGTTILTAANTYTGGTTLNGGILKSGHQTALSTGAIAINSGTTLDLRGGFSSITNTLNNNGGTILRDDGLYLNNVLLTSSAGTPHSAAIVLTKNSTLIQVGAGTYTLSGVISGEYGLTSEIGEGHTLLLTGANTYSGLTTITSGTLQAGNGGTTGTLGTGAIINNSVLKIHRSNEITFSNTISGSGSLIQQGSGTTTLSLANTYAGGTTLNGGILKAGDLASFGTGTIALNTGTVLDLTGGLGNIANTINNSGGTILRDNGLFLNGEWLTSNTHAPYSAAIVLTQNSTLTQLATGTYTLSGVISGEYGLTSDIGSGNTLLLTGSNTYSGTTTITSGTLQTGNGGSTGTLGTGAIINNAILKINRSNELTLSNSISGSGVLTQQGTGKTILPAANTYTGATTVVSGELSISGSLSSPITVKSGALLSSGVNGTISHTVRVETGGGIQGGSGVPGTLTITGLLTLQNNIALNVYSSNTTVSKIETTSTPELGALTVNLKTPMTAGTYTLLQPSGSGTATVTPGENSSILYCLSYSWGTNGLQLTANNNTPIADATLSGGGTLTNATSTGLLAVLSTSQTGVTYTLYKTVNTITSEAATTAGTGNALTFDHLGAGVYTVKGSQDNCIRPMSGSATITTDGTVIKDRLAQNHIPEAVKLTLTREAPAGKHTPYYLSQLYPDFQANVIGDCSDPGYYYAGFQLSYDGSDQNTVANWAAQLSISLIKGTTTTKLTDSLKVDLGRQTFETTTFFKDSIRCLDNYQFKINSKTVKGQVPTGSVRLFIRLYKVPSARPEMSPTAVISNLNAVQNGSTVQLGWLNSLSGVDEYDLEWTFIDHYDNYTSGHEAAFTFQEPARVTVKGLEYTHQVYYPRGKIYYRIRPVGHQKNNPIQRIEGAWRYKEAPIEITNYNTDRTWQQQTIFAEEGKYKKVMSYYDATGRLRQQQTNLSSENATLTAETLYDFEGRKALTVMPAPERGNSLLYKGNLNPFMAGSDVQLFTSATQKKYHYDNGRLPNSLLDSTAIGSAGRYYSVNDTITSLHRNYLPKAAGYAYTQTEYTRDGTGHISRQSGLGQELNIDGPQAMRYYYGSAASEELNRLFGNKVGKAAHYQKDVTVDANGQATVTYKDQEGRTIATALAGTPPTNVEGLASYPAQATTMSLNLTEKNSKKNGLSETVHTFINVSPNSGMTINYTWSARGVQLPTLPPQCTTCGYQLTLELTDPNGAKVNLGNATGDEDPGPSYRKTRTAISCTANADTTMQFTQVVLAEIGDYTLRKTLTPTLLSYQQLRETVKHLTSTTQYRESIRLAHPAKYDACQDCETCNKDSLINAAIREMAEKKCQRIRDTLEAHYKNSRSAHTIDEYLSHTWNNKLICKYNYCKNTIESTIFDTKLLTIKDWAGAVSKDLSTVASVMAADPFLATGNRRSIMTTKMGQVGIRNFPYGHKWSDNTRDILGPIDDVTNPDSTTYYIDEDGRASASGKHFLYYDLQEKLVKHEITQAEYNERLGQQRWALFRQYYSEGKRQIKIEETIGCDSMQAELRKQESLPKTEKEIIDLASRHNTDADKWIQARMTVLAFKSSCAPNITRPDSTAISKMLFNYFKSTPFNYMGVIDEKDSAIDPATNKCKNIHLDSVRVLLEGNYSRCRLADFVTQNPFECLKDTTIYIDEPAPPARQSASAPMAMSMRTDEGADGEELREREMEEERISRMEEEWEERREQEKEEREKEKNRGGKNAFMQMMASTTQSLTPVAEVNALIDLYNSTNGNQWRNTYGFWYPAKSGTMLPVTAPTNISNWYGITLDAERHVVRLNLGNNNLIGPLPVGLSACTRLKWLNLGNNQLTGSIAVLGQLPELETVWLFHNQLSGSLSNLSACTKLKELGLGSNQLTGSIGVLGQLPNLETVRLDHNQLSGSLSNLSACTRLKELLLEHNQLTGSIGVLGQLPNLETVRLDHNQLSGSLPNLSAFTKLKYLNLGNNQLTGSISAALGQLPNLEKVWLNDNKFSGSLPNLSACTKLKWLDLADNEFTGSISVLEQLPNLEEVGLSANKLSSISSLSACTKLKYLDLGDNNLTGNLEELGQLPNLEVLHLYRNQLSGTLSGLSASTKLKYLLLAHNQLTGSIEALGHMPDLEDAWIYSNRLSTLSNLSACTKLINLALADNKFTGSIAALGHLPKLEKFFIYRNQFSGNLSSLLAFTKLRILFLADNKFTGSIDALGHMPDLEEIYLYNNKLSGSLSSLSACTKLTKLYMYGNKFTFANLEGVAGRIFTNWSYAPQDTVDTKQNIRFNPGESITLTTSIDRNTTTASTYRWFKKIGNLNTPLNIESTTGHTCTYTLQSSDLGAEFYYTIKNTNFSSLTLMSHKRKVKKAYTYCLKYRLHPTSKAAKLWDFDIEEQKRKCRAVQDSMASGEVDRLVNTYIDEKTSQLVIKSDTTCLKNAVETLGITYSNKEHHYTLYYYDQAGNLVQTVPPQGVKIAAGGNPPHTLKTTYRYNAQNQVTGQTTPDAGTARFYYNRKGQLRFSQNAQQALGNRYAYTKYDAQGRITETGEATQINLTRIEESHYPEANRTDLTYTHYDTPAHRSPLNQKYLRSRVSYTETIEKNTTDTTRTYYSYDPHGSVNVLLQKLPGLPPKTTHYRYDLVSGKVNYVFYQYKKPDQFVHRYTYDSDNRIREVFTSADRYVWHKDATYQYYLHGPLATTELGHWRNQSLNYTYTLQGWIKGVNTIVPTDNMVGQSVMSYQLGYYKNDYKPIGATQNNVTLWTRAQENIAHQGMYNGNISWMETDLKLFKKPQAMLYKYDQLNRITKSRSLEFSNGNYVVRTGDKKYDENYTYDANGNILTLKRRDNAATLADDFNYSYYSNTNRLLRHKTNGGIYVYDAIGNLITDNNEGLAITWTPSGKVRSVIKSDTTIYFRYDATGNRIAKIVSTAAKNDTTTYVRDASGNVMTIYRNKVVSEVPIYGSSRIGEYSGKEKEGYQTFNLRKYELSNHLGNVLAVISDKVNLYSHGLVVNNKLVLDSARATVVSASDYYPFGLAMKGREFSSSTYRYGFNGHEKDDEIAGLGTHMSWGDYGMDTRLGRRWQPDPNWQKLSGQSPYAVNNNSPVLFYDPDGNWAIFLHYRFTKNALGKAGISLENARRIAHYASVYADNPMGTPKEKIAFKINQVLSAIEFMGKTDRSLLRPQSDINYSPTAGSQSDANEIVQKWHGTRTVSQAEAGITAEMAMADGREFGWGKIFDAANSGNLDESTMANFGQGMHALQDTERHKGAVFSDDNKKRNEHSLIGDWLGNRSSSKEISNSAAKVFSIISGIGDIGKHGRITTTGMSSEQRGQLLNKLGSSGYSYTERQGKIKYTKN